MITCGLANSQEVNMRREMCSRGWYYKQNGATFGPVSLDQLRVLVTTGQLHPRQAVWQVGDHVLLYLHASTVVSCTREEILGRNSAKSVQAF
jgi:hypothetical protein